MKTHFQIREGCSRYHWHTDRYGEGTCALLFGAVYETSELTGLNLLGFCLPFNVGQARKICRHTDGAAINITNRQRVRDT